MGRIEIGQEFWGSVLESVLKSGLTSAILQLLGKELSLIERLKSWNIGHAKTWVPSFKNLPDKLSMLAALDGFKPFKILKFFSGDISKSWKFKSLDTVLLS